MTIVVSDKSKLTPKQGSDYEIKKIKVNSQRSLTINEINMAKEVFKNSIDYSKVKIIRGGLLGLPNLSNSAMTPFGKIHLPNQSYNNTKDFGLDSVEATLKLWYIHEMTHVWQYQLGYSNAVAGINTDINGGYTSRALAYDYDLVDKNKKFNEYNMEQQAEIISHYFDTIYRYSKGHDAVNLHASNIRNKTDLARVLSEFIVNPSNKELISKQHGQENYWFD
ncbi:zinc protease [Acinetobacter guerrae]|uniref:zinc protease n=1 Tax=Acinetobacter guerrae TaxID=1843371 RepID=UPI00128B43F6|nr:zinc protease [Acinetobacter guerrae]MPW45515.1 hypothetical protein [Acinetobacter guerrae]